MSIGWQEVITDWSLDISQHSTGTIGTSFYDSYEGSGKRIFKQIEGGTATLPSYGDPFIDNSPDASPSTYQGIYLTSITYAKTHNTCTGGKTAICNYSSTKYDNNFEKDAYGEYTGQYKVITKEGKNFADWAWYTDNDVDGTAVDLTSPANMRGIAAQTLKWAIPNGEFKIKLELSGDSEFNDFKDDFIGTYAGCVNNKEFKHFPVGCVLCSTFDASKEIRYSVPRWIVYVTFNWQVVPLKNNAGVRIASHDGWQFMPTTHYVNNLDWSRPVQVERSEGAGIQRGLNWLYPYADLNTFISDYGGDPT